MKQEVANLVQIAIMNMLTCFNLEQYMTEKWQAQDKPDQSLHRSELTDTSWPFTEERGNAARLSSLF